MITRIFLFVALLLPVSLFASQSPDTLMIGGVMKIITYERDPISGNYIKFQYGSAVLTDTKKIVTNAHVILGKNGSPTGLYEVCRTEKNKKEPVCFSAAKLVSYDTIADLALLELNSPNTSLRPVSFSAQKNLSIGNSVVVYGYPSIGGNSITRTEGKIGGFEDEKYKFDGTIDHGNSGGGAFSSDGKLIGIPYAVKSDNGTIGYIIPTSIVKDFLLGRTESIENYTFSLDAQFVNYIKNIQKLYVSKSIKTQFVEIKNPDKYGFFLNSAIQSNGDGRIFSYKFFDKNNRVGLIVQCSSDASFTWDDEPSFNQQVFLALKTTLTKGYTLKDEYLDEAKTIYRTEVSSVKNTKGIQAGFSDISYKKAPMCASTIIASDAPGKDSKSYQNAITLAKTVQFLNPANVDKKQFRSPYYTISNIPKNTYFSESIAVFDSSQIYPYLFMFFPDSQTIAKPDFELFQFDTLDDYMNYGYSDTNEYQGKTYTMQSFFERYRTTGYDNVEDRIIKTQDEKSLIRTIENYKDADGEIKQNKKVVTFFYPFQGSDQKYYAYKMKFTIAGSVDDMDVNALTEVIRSITFPGFPPFK